MLTTRTRGKEEHASPAHAGAELRARSKEERGKARQQAGPVTGYILKAVPKTLPVQQRLYQKTGTQPKPQEHTPPKERKHAGAVAGAVAGKLASS
jgi:hypothetical protein